MVNSTHASPQRPPCSSRLSEDHGILAESRAPGQRRQGSFIALDFSRSEWEIFANALGRLPLTADVTESMETCTVRSILLTGNWKIQQANRLGCVRFGLAMRERIFRGW